MNIEASKALTQQFYAWERRGRGWTVCNGAVDPEPPFHPFFGHTIYKAPQKDDSRHPTILSFIADLFRGENKTPAKTARVQEIPLPTGGYVFDCPDELTCYRVVLPKNQKVTIEDMEHVLLMLSYTAYPVSFEIIATSAYIRLQFTVRESDEAQVYGQLKAYYPTAIISEHPDGLSLLKEDCKTCVIDYGLAQEFMRPLRTAHEVDKDPFIGLFGMLEAIQKGEQATVQIIFQGTANPWAESIMRSVTDSSGGSFFADAPEMVKLAEEKVSAPLFGVCIKVIAQADRSDRAIEIARSIGTTITSLTGSKSNCLQPLSQNGYAPEDVEDDIYERQSHRLGMLLNSNELATLVHFPTPEIVSPKVERDTRKTKAAPDSAQGHDFILGKNSYHGHEQIVSVPASLRLKHTHVIGATGTGKSTLVLSMVAQDMQLGNGLAVLDPHGDLIEAILAYVPKERINDVIVIDPSDGEYPVGFNILSAHSEVEKDILSSDLVAAFKRLSTSWGDQMNSVLANAILAFLESPEGGTLVDLRRFLIEKPFRDAYLKTVKDSHVVYYWQHEYPLLKSNSIGSILTRLDTFLRPKLIRNMVGQKKGLDFEQILDTKKILLIKLSQGLIGAENSFLLGTFFVSKMYQAAMARQAKDKDSRNDFFLYIDEFQNFITPSMSHILSGARKYHLGLILAHQDMTQLQRYDTELASSVVVNAGTRICFRLGDMDARRFASGFSYFDAEDLENLHTGEAIARIEQPNFDFSLSTLPLPELRADIAEATTQAVIAKSREQYATPKEIVERGLEHLGAVVKEEVQETIEKEVVQDEAPKKSTPTPVAPVVVPRKAPPTKKTETQHRYLQTLIKKMAESRGYKAMIEEAIPDGKGSVDVSLERNGKRIAVEVSVTTGDEWEAHNVEKCLAAGYGDVIVCSSDAKNLQRIRELLESKLSKKQQAKVLTLEPGEVVRYFDKQIVQESSTETIVKGYRVSVDYDTSTTNEMAKKQERVAKAVRESVRKRNK